MMTTDPAAQRRPAEPGAHAAKSVRAWVVAGSRPTIVLGRSQHGLQPATALPVRRRASGGGAMLDGPWLLRALVRLPRAHPLANRGPLPLARWLGDVHLRWLRAMGLHGARLHADVLLEHWACFGGRGPGEVLVAGRKLVGIAQAWFPSCIAITSGTLLHVPPWSLLCQAFEAPGEAGALASGTVALEECLGEPVDPAASGRGLHTALEDALDESCCHRPARGILPPG